MNQVKAWCEAHPKATAVIAAAVFGFFLAVLVLK